MYISVYTAMAGPQQWRFINCIIEGFWKLESVCWRTRLYSLARDTFTHPVERMWELRWQHFPDFAHCCGSTACLAFSTLCFVPVRVFIVWRRQEYAVGGEMRRAGTSSEIVEAACSTNWAFSFPTNTGVRKTTCAKVHLKLHCWELRLQHRVSATSRLSVSFYRVVT